MCGVSGFTGLGHLSTDVRFDLVEALGIGIDSRGGHAAGAVVVPEEGQPRLMRKLGTWGAARGRFTRAAAGGHSVMMHARFATHGSRDSVDNAHPFAVKRMTLDGQEKTVLYGCHNGIIHGTQETARANNRSWSVDSKEFFELLADGAYETIKALNGYGVVTFVRPDDRAIRVLRLTTNSDFVAVSIVGGGMVWGSTKSIIKDALEYTSPEAETWFESLSIGRVYRLSGSEARETKLDGITVQSSSADRRTSGGHYYSHNYTHRRTISGWDDACYRCGEFYYHLSNCRFKQNVIDSETIKKNMKEYQEEKAKLEKAAPASSSTPRVRVSSSDGHTGKRYVECEDGTFRPLSSNGKDVDNYTFPIYVREQSTEGAATGAYVKVWTNYDACKVSGKDVPYWSKPKDYAGMGMRVLGKDEREGAKTLLAFQPRFPVTPSPESTRPTLTGGTRDGYTNNPPNPPGHNGHWAIPHGISEEERQEWEELYRIAPRLTEAMAKDGASEALRELQRLTEEADLEDAAEELESQFVRQMVKGE